MNRIFVLMVTIVMAMLMTGCGPIFTKKEEVVYLKVDDHEYTQAELDVINFEHEMNEKYGEGNWSWNK